MSDPFDKTETSIIWNPGDDQGRNSSGEVVAAPNEDLEEATLKAEILDLLQSGGVDFIKEAFPNNIFVEDVVQEPIPPDDPDEEPLPESEE